MKKMVRLVIKYLLYGISLGCTFFVIMCLSFYVGRAGVSGDDFPGFCEAVSRGYGGRNCMRRDVGRLSIRPVFRIWESADTFLCWNGGFLPGCRFLGMDSILPGQDYGHSLTIFIFLLYFYGDLVRVLSVQPE